MGKSSIHSQLFITMFYAPLLTQSNLRLKVRQTSVWVQKGIGWPRYTLALSPGSENRPRLLIVRMRQGIFQSENPFTEASATRLFCNKNCASDEARATLSSELQDFLVEILENTIAMAHSRQWKSLLSLDSASSATTQPHLLSFGSMCISHCGDPLCSYSPLSWLQSIHMSKYSQQLLSQSFC